MAFTGESKRDLKQFQPKAGSGDIGPGQYHNEGFLHKLAMDTIYPKKQAPFNSNSHLGARFDLKEDVKKSS